MLLALSRRSRGGDDAQPTAAFAAARTAARHGLSAEAFWRAAEALAAGNLLPNQVFVRGADLRISDSSLGARYELDLETLDFTHQMQDGVVLFSARAASGGGGLSTSMHLDYDRRRATTELAAEALPLPRIRHSAFSLRGGRVSADITADVRNASVPRVAGTIACKDVAFRAPILTSDPVSPLDARWRFEASLDAEAGPWARATEKPVSSFSARYLPQGEIIVHSGEATVNGITLETAGTLHGLFEPARRAAGLPPRLSVPGVLPRLIELELVLPETPVARIHDAIPPAVLGPLVPLEVRGNFAWRLDLRIPRYAIGGMSWTAEPALEDFAVVRIPESVNPYKLNDSFLHIIGDPAVGFTRTVRIPPAREVAVEWLAEHAERTLQQVQRMREAMPEPGPEPEVIEEEHRAGATAKPGAVSALPYEGKPDPEYEYVRLEDMSPWVTRAVLTAEDGDFFFHDGVNFVTLPQALERNLRAGEIRYGASTITMQLVKMLFLDDDRILARKLQEVFLVYLTEHEVPVSKTRILEIYLNIAEFGPGVYGIANAAQYYFGTDADALGPGEAVWLASILPSPRRYHRYYELGYITDGWFERMESYFDIMLERGRMTEEEYEEAMKEKPEFSLFAAGNPALELTTAP
jgi:hypothetical protein